MQVHNSSGVWGPAQREGEEGMMREAADLVNELAAELVLLHQHLVPQVDVHALHNVTRLDFEQTASMA